MVFLIIAIIASVWFLYEIIKLSFVVAWGAAKVIAWILSILALPLLFIFAFAAGYAFLFIPLALLGGAFGLLKTR